MLSWHGMPRPQRRLARLPRIDPGADVGRARRLRGPRRSPAPGRHRQRTRDHDRARLHPDRRARYRVVTPTEALGTGSPDRGGPAAQRTPRACSPGRAGGGSPRQGRPQLRDRATPRPVRRSGSPSGSLDPRGDARPPPTWGRPRRASAPTGARGRRRCRRGLGRDHRSVRGGGGDLGARVDRRDRLERPVAPGPSRRRQRRHRPAAAGAAQRGAEPSTTASTNRTTRIAIGSRARSNPWVPRGSLISIAPPPRPSSDPSTETRSA